MSRAYEFAVEAYPVRTEDEVREIAEVIGCEMGTDVSHWLSPTEHEEGARAYWDGDTTLCGGESEEEANTRLCQKLYQIFPFLEEVETKWLCTEYQQWDETFINAREDFGKEEDE